MPLRLFISFLGAIIELTFVIIAWLKAPKTHKEAKAAEEKDETIDKLRMQLKEAVSGQCHWQLKVKVKKKHCENMVYDQILYQFHHFY